MTDIGQQTIELRHGEKLFERDALACITRYEEKRGHRSC